MIKVILWDVDGTLLDFEKAEYAAMKICFNKFGLGECTDEMIERYAEINKRYWERLERGEVTRQQVLICRFEDFFQAEGIVSDCAAELNLEYQRQLGENVFFCDDSYDLLSQLKASGKVKQYAVTNGSKVAQDGKLNKSGLINLFDDVFISEVVGVEKPGIGFFEHVWEKIGTYPSGEVMIIGDSLTSDMQGGNNAGILTCWYNPKGLENNKGVKLDYEIRQLKEVMNVLEECK
jgi:2-haloacid dehalogenase